MERVSSTELLSGAADSVCRALTHLGFKVTIKAGSPGSGSCITISVDEREVVLRVEARAYGTGALVAELIDRYPPGQEHRILVADKITSEAGTRLTEAGWSWFDRRGRLHLTGPGIRVDMDVPPDPRVGSAPGGRDPVAGPAGLAIAYWLCAHPTEAVSPTGLKPVLGYAPSTISTANRRLSDAGLLGNDGVGLFPELFWELAAAWRPVRVWLAAVPPLPRTPIDPTEQRWCRTGTAVAAAYGAPVVSAGDGLPELYLSGPVELDIVRRRYHAVPPGAGAATVAVAPVRAVTDPATDGAEVPVIDGWPAAPVLAVALDLAQDQARGRQILADWDFDGAVWQ